MEYFTNICGKCNKEFRTNIRARGYCYTCNPFSASYKGIQQPVFITFPVEEEPEVPDVPIEPDVPVEPEVPEIPVEPEVPETPELENFNGVLSTLTPGGVVLENDVSFRTALVIDKSPETDLESGVHRNENWYLGIQLTAPEGYASGAIYKSRVPRLNPADPADEWDAIEAKSFDDFKDGDYFIGLWHVLNPKFVDNYVNAGLDIVYDHIIDWNGDGEYEQTITVTVDPAQVILRSVDGLTTVYPVSQEE